MNIKKNIYYILIAIFAAIFLLCAVQVATYFIESYQHNEFYNNLASLKSEATGTAGSAPSGSLDPTADSLLPTGPSGVIQKPMLEDMKSIFQMNPHTVGWIQIDGTRINYPVLQTPNEPAWRDYYLYRNFEGQEDRRGSIYAREACDVFTPSDNITIYGHNMADHSMFGELFDYKYYSYYQEHKYIYFDTLYEQHTYEIYAIFRTSGTLGQGFAYHMFVNAGNQQEFDDFVAQCKSLSMHDIPLTPQYGDKLITLSTCDFHIDNGRLVICAVRID